MYCYFAKFVSIWYTFPVFGMFGPRKIWQPCQGSISSTDYAHGRTKKVDTFYRHHLKWGQFLAGFRVQKQGDLMSS
jgi:hypothetical protein